MIAAGFGYGSTGVVGAALARARAALLLAGRLHRSASHVR